MTVKLPLNWRRSNQVTTDVITYSDPATAYSSAAAFYSAPAMASTALGWTKPSKASTAWKINPAALMNRRAYDTHTAYDQHVTYDGIVVGQDSSDTKQPTVWRQA